MTSNLLRAAAILILAFLALATAGCSRVSIAYNSADFFIERYAKDYLELDDPQIASWQPELEGALARHRREDLPHLARFFDTAHAGAVKGFDAQRMRCLIDQFEGLYRRHLGVAVDLAAPLLASLTPDQIRALGKKFREELAEDEVDTDPAGTARRDRKRAKRYQESMTWWLGPLSNEQKAIVQEQTAAMPDTAAAWIAYRSAKRERLIRLLEQRAGETEVHRFLEAWLVQHQDLPPGLRRAKDRIGTRISELFIRMDATFSPKQRAHFADRLATLRDDFMKLQRRPRMATVKCST